MLLDILFVFCKLNPDLGYRQGMHELLAPMLWVVERDALDLGQSSKAMGEDAVIRTVYDADHIEHDAFALFGQVMQNAKNFYEQTTHAAAENPMVSRSKRIVFELLPKVDPDLANHMERLDIMPQVFLMRWIRLLFGREFPFDDILTMWDVIFANDSSLEVVDHICLAMLLRIRWELMESDYNGALTLLLRYPPLPKDFAPQTLALDALYLREHMHTEGGGYLVLKYTDRPLQPGDRPATPPALQRNITAFSGVSAAKAALGRAGLSPESRPKQARNIESIFQSAAKNIQTRSEQFNIGKAVRNAVDEVHRKAQEISNAPTPSSRNRGPRTAYGSVLHKVKELEARNAQLGKLLDAAVADLWDYQKVAAEDDPQNSKASQEPSSSLEKLSVAIAKVQFVQVYLGDSSLPLPAEETDNSASLESSQSEAPRSPAPEKAATDDKQAVASASQSPNIPAPDDKPDPSSQPQANHEKLADPSTFDDDDDDDDPFALEPTPSTQPSNPPNITVNQAPSSLSPEHQTQPPPSPPAPRPSLSESSYSWMLGSSDSTTNDTSAPSTATSTRKASPSPSSSFFDDQRRNRGFLFGDDEAGDGNGGAEEATAQPPTLKVVSRRGRAHKKNFLGAGRDSVKEGEGGGMEGEAAL